jgi:hypothetical protein
MLLRNHIAYKFLTDEAFLMRLLFVVAKPEMERLEKNGVDGLDKQDLFTIGGLGGVLMPQDQKAYYITDTVHKALDLIKVGKLDWTIFNNQPDKKLTFIFGDSRLLRVNIRDISIDFFYLSGYKEDKLKYLQFYIDKKTGTASTEFRGLDDSALKLECYRLLCFMFFSKNEERVVKAGTSYGTRKQVDALSNDLPYPVTIVNTNWNITSIRTDGFNVSGHFRLQPCGVGFMDRKFVFIQPFKKKGYIRKATNLTHAA